MDICLDRKIAECNFDVKKGETMKIKLFKRTTCKLVFAGLMLNLIATSLPLHAISFPEPRSAQEAAKQQRELQRWEKEQQKIMQRTDQRAQQRADIDVKISLLKKRLKQMKKARIAMIAVIGTAGVTIGLWGAGLLGSVALALAATGVPGATVSVIGVTASGVLYAAGTVTIMYTTEAVTLALIYAGISAGVGSVIALSPGLFAVVSGLSDIDKIKKTVKELKQIEKTSPGTLTEEHKVVIEQLTNSFKNPIIRGISRAIAQTKALDTIVKTVLQNNPQLAQSLGKKAAKRLNKHIFWNWQLANFKDALSSLKKWNPKYMPLAIRKKITKAQLKKLYKKHPGLKNLQQPINDFTDEIKRIRAGFAKIK